MIQDQALSSSIPELPARPIFEDPIRERWERFGCHLPSTLGPIRSGVILDSIKRVSICRSLYLSLRFKGRFLVGRNVKLRIHRSARIDFQRGSYLLFGLHHESTKPPLLNMGLDTRLVLRGTAQVWRGSEVIILRGGQLELGNKTVLNEGSRIICCKQVTLGGESGLSWNASVLDTDLHPISFDGTARQMDAPVIIGRHSMIGYGAIILKGVTIGDSCIVAAGSVVTRDVPSGTAVAGNPARQVASGVQWS